MNQQDALKKGRTANAEMYDWSHSSELKDSIRQDKRTYQAIADDYGLKITTIKNIKAAYSKSLWRHRNVEIKNENDRFRAAFHEMQLLLAAGEDVPCQQILQEILRIITEMEIDAT